MIRSPLRDLGAALAAVLLVVAAILIGRHIEDTDGTLFVNWPPLLASWGPHVGPGTPAAIAVAIAVVAYGPGLAARLPWRALLAVACGTAMAWTWSLALIDGWHRGVAQRLTTRYEYLQVIDRFQDIPATLRDFTEYIVIQGPDHWPAHIAGHPPAATPTFVLLDRIGRGGGAWAGIWCITVGATAVTAVLLMVRGLTGEGLARRAAPFVVLAPGAVWMGTSADGYFTAVAAWSVALLALAVTGRPGARSRIAAGGAGLLFGLTCYLSYGLTLIGIIGLGVFVLGRNRRAVLLPLLAGLAVFPLVFTLAGFNYWEAYHLLVERYNQGAGGVRPYGYWVWANPACTVLVVGLATVAGLSRAGGTLVGQRRPFLSRPGDAEGAVDEGRLAVLLLGAFLALLAADLSGMSKAETERIWLPFALWLLAACAFLPRPRVWLTAQAVVALLVNHLLWTGW
ncbi:hypothetical protein [Streptomyces sp. KR55]|uniref:hypothetical protein n=1 Tax=Streptomyces sp. KR55 TaxID=3457425 RepID=UPI003FD4CD0D